MINNWIRYAFPKYVDKTVNSEDCFRVLKAKEQIKLSPAQKEDIVLLCRQYFKEIGIDIPIIEINLNDVPIKRGFYSDLMEKYNLAEKKDILWLKFTTDEYLGVVAASNDINFSYENTSGKIISYLNKNWDDKYIIIIPLISGLGGTLNRQRFESGLGNYLISHNVPILDCFSHNL